jgi:hypothetical protein
VTATGPRVLISTPWTAQGLTTLSVHLGRLLESLGCAVTYHAWKHPQESKPRFDAPGWPEDARVNRQPFDRLDLSQFAIVIWPEVVETAQVQRANVAGCKTVWLPMWEFVGKPHPVDTWADWSLVVSPTKCCHDLLASLDRESDTLPWWCDYPPHAPRTTPDEPVYLHVVRGTPGDPRNTTAVLDGWRDFKQSGGRGRLIVKTIAPLRTFIRNHNLPPACEVLAGCWDRRKLWQLYQMADVFV